VATAAAGTVLVVEDDNDVREALLHVLHAEGYRAVPACDGLDALTQLEGGLEPCVILLDLMMPRMNGWQFVEKQRARGGSVPIVVVSAYDAPEKLRSLGVVEYLRKPVDIDVLLGIVARFCRAARA
jgi:two-component system, chemotaxis family, chemotaxis protein CheY